jgi:hypothetical protein
MKPLKKILKDILKEVPKNVNTKNYVFLCSIDHSCNIKRYKGYKVYYSEMLQYDYIAFTHVASNENINDSLYI